MTTSNNNEEERDQNNQENGNCVGTSNNASFLTDRRMHDSVPFVGLVNQGMTCYLNSLIQALYMTPEFRDLVWSWNTEDLAVNSLPYELKHIFVILKKTKRTAIETTALTRSFGWDTSYCYQQHDVQELFRVLFDALDTCFKNTDEVRKVKDLYEGEMIDYVKCLKCDTVKSRKDFFQDIPLTVKPYGRSVGYGTLEEAIQGFVEPERLVGANQYSCETCNEKCDANKGLAFVKLPYILTLQLKRFDFDYLSQNRVKLNDRMTFPEILNMNAFMKANVTSEKLAENTTPSVLSNGVKENMEVATDNDSDNNKEVSMKIDTTTEEKNDLITSISNGVKANQKEVPLKIDVKPNNETNLIKASFYNGIKGNMEGATNNYTENAQVVDISPENNKNSSTVSLSNGIEENTQTAKNNNCDNTKEVSMKIDSNPEDEKEIVTFEVKLKSTANGVNSKADKTKMSEGILKKKVVKKAEDEANDNSVEEKKVKVVKKVIKSKLDPSENSVNGIKAPLSESPKKKVLKKVVKTKDVESSDSATPKKIKVVKKVIKKKTETKEAEEDENGLKNKIVKTEPEINGKKTAGPSNREQNCELEKNGINGNAIDSKNEQMEAIVNEDLKYELFAVLIHSGSAVGGHYFAYIKSLETKRWYCFNDRTVTQISNERLADAYGGSTISGSKTRSSNAYMLKYRKIDKDRNVDKVESAELPESIDSQILEDLLDELTTSKAPPRLDMVRVRIWYNMKDIKKDYDGEPEKGFVKVYSFCEATLNDMKNDALELIFTEGEQRPINPDMFRLVQYDETTEAILNSYEGRENNRVVDLVEERLQAAFFLELRTADGEFENYGTTRMQALLFKVSDNYEIVENAVRVVNQNDALSHLKDLAAEAFSFERDRLTIMLDKPNVKAILLEDESKCLKDLGCDKKSRYYVTDQGVSNKLIGLLSHQQYAIHIYIVLPPIQEDDVVFYNMSDDSNNAHGGNGCFVGNPLNGEYIFFTTDRTLFRLNVQRRVLFTIDVRAPMTWIRGRIAAICGFSVVDVKISTYNLILPTPVSEVIIYSEALEDLLGVYLRPHYQLTELHVHLPEYHHNEKTKGIIFLLDIYNEDMPYGQRIDVTVNKNIKVSELKAQAIKAMNEKYSLALEFDRCRLRKKIRSYVKDVICDTDRLTDVLSLHLTWELCLQEVEEGQKLFSTTVNGLFFFYKIFHPSTCKLNEIKEVYLPNGTEKEFQDLMPTLCGIPLENMHVTFGSTCFPYTTSMYMLNKQCSWMAADNMVLWAYKMHGDGHVVIIKDNREEGKSGTNEEDKNDYGGKEKSLKIFVGQQADKGNEKKECEDASELEKMD